MSGGLSICSKEDFPQSFTCHRCKEDDFQITSHLLLPQATTTQHPRLFPSTLTPSRVATFIARSTEKKI